MAQVFDSKNKLSAFLLLQLATKYYTKWDCDIQIKTTQKGYFKCLEGYGEVQFSNGNHYKGNFFNGLMHGEGVFLWSNGLKYTGPFQHNCITGLGAYQWKDGSWYKGQVLNGKRHGKGQYFCAKDNSKYKGQWKDGLRNGFGVLDFNQQTSYQGYFRQGLRQGKGKMKYASGNVYQGQWKNDKKSGFGTMNWFTQNQKYEGEWLNDLQHGIGTYYWFDGKIQYKIIKNIYKGNWVHGQRDGFGSFFYANGCRYEGYFDQNRKNGNGLVLDEYGNIKLQYFEKDKLVYTIPQKVQIKSDISVNKVTNINPDKKLSQKLNKQLKTTPNSLHEQSVNKLPKGSKLLPSLSKQAKQTNSINTPAENTQFPKSHILNDKQAKYKIQENIYQKCLDIPTCTQSDQQSQNSIFGNKFYVCKQIMNLLLRQNSRLKQWYKHFSLAISTANNNCKDFYTGVTIQNMFKLIKDLKLMDEELNIPLLNRQFYLKGWKSVYQVALPNEEKLNLIKDHLQKSKLNKSVPCEWDKVFNNQKINYWNIQWNAYTDSLENIQSEQNEQQKKLNSNKQVDLNTFNDIHHPKKIILFRHFICYLLKIAYLQTQKHTQNNLTPNQFQKQFRNNLEKLFKSIHGIYQLAQRQTKGTQSTDNLTYVSKQKSNYNVSQDFSKLNQELFNELTKKYQNFHNFSDNTVNVKVLYQLLEKFSILKQPAEKLLFLQKIERFMEGNSTKTSLLRKQMKNHFNSLEKVIYESPYFQRFLNYTLIQKQFEDLLYLAVNRKINTNSKEQSLKKYKQILEAIINFVKSELSPQMSGKKHKTVLKIKKQYTQKDRMRDIMIKQNQQKKNALIQMQKKKVQQKKEQIERFKMGRQDFRWQQYQMSESDEYFD